MFRRNGSTIKLIVVAVFVLFCVYFIYLYNGLNGRFRNSEDMAMRYRREHESLSATYQVLLEQKARFELSLQQLAKEMVTNKAARAELTKENEDLQQVYQRDKELFTTKLDACSQQQKVLMSQQADLQNELDHVHKENENLAEDHQEVESRNNLKYQQLKQEKELEISILTGEVANFDREKGAFAMEHNNLRKKIQEIQTQVDYDQAVIAELQQRIKQQQQSLIAQGGNQVQGQHNPLGQQNMFGGQQNQQPVGIQQNRQPVDIQQNQQPVGIQQNQQPVGIQQNRQPVGIQQNREPVGIQQNQQPVGIQQNQQPIGIQQNRQPVGIQQQGGLFQHLVHGAQQEGNLANEQHHQQGVNLMQQQIHQGDLQGQVQGAMLNQPEAAHQQIDDHLLQQQNQHNQAQAPPHEGLLHQLTGGNRSALDLLKWKVAARYPQQFQVGQQQHLISDKRVMPAPGNPSLANQYQSLLLGDSSLANQQDTKETKPSSANRNLVQYMGEANQNFPQHEVQRPVLLLPGVGIQQEYDHVMKQQTGQSEILANKPALFNSLAVNQHQDILRQVLLPPGNEKQQQFFKNVIESAENPRHSNERPNLHQQVQKNTISADRIVDQIEVRKHMIPMPDGGVAKQEMLQNLEYHGAIKKIQKLDSFDVPNEIKNQESQVGLHGHDSPDGVINANQFDSQHVIAIPDNDIKQFKLSPDGEGKMVFRSDNSKNLFGGVPDQGIQMFQQQQKKFLAAVENNNAAPHDSHLPDPDVPDGNRLGDSREAQPVEVVVAANDIQVQPAMPNLP